MPRLAPPRKPAPPQSRVQSWQAADTAYPAPMLTRQALLAVTTAAFAAGADWQPFCNGTNLDGWQVECREPDRAKPYWRVHDGAIECDTAGDKKHDYVWLVSEREFGDFEFECLVQTFADSPGNSGIQIRSRFVKDPQQGDWMHGPQIDLHPPTPWRCGLIYDETRGTQHWICPSLPDWNIAPAQAPAKWCWIHADGSTRNLSDADPADATRIKQLRDRGNWNQIRIVARGLRIETDVNGLPISRFDGTGILDDEAHRKQQVGLHGHLALQLHAGDDLKIRFKDLRIRNLAPLTKQSPVP